MSDRIITETLDGGLTVHRRVLPTTLRGPWIDFLAEEARWCDEFRRRVVAPMLASEAERIDKAWGEVSHG